MSTTIQTEPSAWRPSTAEELLAKGAHRATLPSGAEVLVRFPGIGALLQADDVPTELRELASLEMARTNGSAQPSSEAIAKVRADDAGDDAWQEVNEKLEELHRFHLWLVAEHTLVEPRVTAAQLAGMDERDVDWLVAIATRRTDEDARGVRLGVMSLSDMAVFREEHGCSALDECEACSRGQRRLSSPRRVPV